MLPATASSGGGHWGDLVVFGPRPAEVLQLLSGLPSIELVMGNTDRHVVEGTSAFSMAGAGTRGVAWTQGGVSKPGCSTGCRACPPRRPWSFWWDQNAGDPCFAELGRWARHRP